MKTLRFAVLTLALILFSATLSFSAETKTYGQLLSQLEIVHGLEQGLAESTAITRSELIVLLVRILERDAGFSQPLIPLEPSFHDVAPTHWAYNEIETAKALGITSGFRDGTFGTGDPVTYAQTVLFLARALDYNTSGILYGNSVYRIRETLGLTLSKNTGPDMALKRGDVFELISQALNKNKGETNQTLLSTLTLEEKKQQQFLNDYTLAIQGNDSPSAPTSGKDLLDFEAGYTYSSYDLYDKAKALVERYPQILEMETLGYSNDSRPIYVLRMTDPINESSDASYVNKMHLFVEAGTHARETYNPFLVMRIIEDYAKDYYNEAILANTDMKSLLQNNVLHFMPLVNPDGFDVVKFGPGMIKDPILKTNFLQLLGRGSYATLKANIRGVDLNRNYQDEILDTDASVWKSLRGILEGNITASPYPALQFFGGTGAASEVETQLSQAYMLRYDFRAYLSYHSQGRVIMGQTSLYGLELETQSKEHEALLLSITGYTRGTSTGSAYGYASRFAAFNTYKTLSTIETMTTTAYPDNKAFYKSEYITYHLNQLPLALLSQAQKDGYGLYKIYVKGRYVRDIKNRPYAFAISQRLGGDVVPYPGKPLLYSSEIWLEK